LEVLSKSGFSVRDAGSDKKGGRNDLVQNLGTYKDICNTMQKFITAIKTELSKKHGTFIDDSRAALWVRDILLYGKPSTRFINPTNNIVLKFEDISAANQMAFLKFLINFAYLLFGCEVQRNPASLITHQMALDLIIAGKMTWEKAIADPANANNCGGGALPMTMGSYKKEKLTNDDLEKKSSKSASAPVGTARLIHQRYNVFSIKKWVYEGKASGTSPSKHRHIKEFIKREHAIVRDWIFFKSKQKGVSEKEFNLENEVRESLKIWYPQAK
jgi:hypothetical protein